MFLFNIVSHLKGQQTDFQRDHPLEVKMCFYHTSLFFYTHFSSQVVSVAGVKYNLVRHVTTLKIIQCVNNSKWKRQSVLKV